MKLTQQLNGYVTKTVARDTRLDTVHHDVNIGTVMEIALRRFLSQPEAVRKAEYAKFPKKRTGRNVCCTCGLAAVALGLVLWNCRHHGHHNQLELALGLPWWNGWKAEFSLRDLVKPWSAYRPWERRLALCVLPTAVILALGYFLTR